MEVRSRTRASSKKIRRGPHMLQQAEMTGQKQLRNSHNHDSFLSPKLFCTKYALTISPPTHCITSQSPTILLPWHHASCYVAPAELSISYFIIIPSLSHPPNTHHSTTRRGITNLVGNVGDMSATCRRQGQMSAFGPRHTTCRRHNFRMSVRRLCREVPTRQIPAKKAIHSTH
jgi:hypothetical protein